MGRSTVVTGWGMSLPDQVRTNQDLESIVDTTDEWIRSRTGIRERRIASEDESTYTLALEASKQALETAKLSPEDVEMIIVATLTPDFGFPAVSNLLQDALDASDAAAVDINSACTGFLSGLALADGLIVSGHLDNVLLVGAETMSRVVDWSDRATCVLFGDAAGAAVLQKSDSGGGILKSVLGSDGSGAMSLYLRGGGSRYQANAHTIANGDHFLKMDGREVYRFAVKAMVDCTIDTARRAGVPLDEFDLFIPHQANIRIINSAIRELDVPESKFFVNVDRYGNTSAASIPVALCEAIDEGRIEPGSKVMMVAFGAGLAWAGTALEWTAPVPDRGVVGAGLSARERLGVLPS
ncbi:MAG: ketoacyl-ACP synthase III [Chloroflexi bacterium]|nr:ketoacyl-ACP synthase III [Chloroflexota bacterium]MCY3938950.1 ketoacyl-ACP synthase III [Chloroflexota bacterium]